MSNNLFIKQNGRIALLTPQPFMVEEEFERFIFDTPEILGDLFLLNRQIRGGRKTGIPDVIGLDSDNNVYIIEIKNVEVDAYIIPQVLQYAFWAETNPDSIKTMWLEATNKPDFQIDWDNLEVRIAVIAPKINPSTLHMVQRIRYDTDLIEVVRWQEKDETLILVNRLEAGDDVVAVKPVRGLAVVDAAFYREYHSHEAVDQFMKYADELKSLVEQRNWNLDQKFTQETCAFKLGFFRVFGVWWENRQKFAFFLRVSKKDVEKFGRPADDWNDEKTAVYYIDPNKTKVMDFLPLFEHSYANIARE